MGSSNKQIHLIAFDVPYPPNYGGVIDIYYKAVELQKMGVKIHLHCFEYGRPRNNQLDKICESVTYYKRRKSKFLLFSRTPYIVGTRNSEQLIGNLNKDNYPIICEGLHTTGIIKHLNLKKRKVYVRTHNVEHDYYRHLAKNESKLAHRMYYKREARKLKAFESILKQCSGVFAISPSDAVHFEKINNNVELVYPFHPFQKINAKPGTGKYAIYHGNLKVNENNKAAVFLAEQVFNDIDYPLLITGSGASNYLKHLVSENENIELKENIPSKEMLGYMQGAHMHILPTFQATGMKLKLISALFNGRYCVVNSEMIENTGVEKLCKLANSSTDFKERINELASKPFPSTELKNRKEVLGKDLSNHKNAQKIVNQIFSNSTPS
ncbi:MAG: glycosyltransferase [Bacteroidia bacterium]|nr:glycosyltransferase [Bacteroidia bacterium]